MKYMGSKRKMLQNGLGVLLRQEMRTARRFVDLFSGSGVVSRFVAERFRKPVVAVDLQAFATTLAASWLCRTSKIKSTACADRWVEVAKQRYTGSRLRKSVVAWARECGAKKLFKKNVLAARELCGEVRSGGVTWNAYGGYYLSPKQALQVDCLLECLPRVRHNECLAALITSISKSVAAPGHTAQPFQPTKDALPYIQDAWKRDMFEVVKREFSTVAKRCAKVRGQVSCGGAQDFAETRLQDGDLVFIDPPYSGVQYSRFYHVLETIANKRRVEVSGRGRYPGLSERPQSDFSNKGASIAATRNLLAALARRRLTAIITFPSGMCSNGLSGRMIAAEARKHFSVKVMRRKNDFSTLGGNNENREARQETTEWILVLKTLNGKFQQQNLFSKRQTKQKKGMSPCRSATKSR